MKHFLSNLVLLVSAVVVGLGLMEFATRVFFDPVDFLLPKLVVDSFLGHKIEPGSGGHDDWGFRNKTRPEAADIVAIGDSMTYGIAATSDGAWPSQLQQLSGKTVYNLALGGYGPIQYLHLLRTKAKSLRPSVVIVGLYFGNDLVDAYSAVYSNENWAKYRTASHVGGTKENVNLRPETERTVLRKIRDFLSQRSLLYRVVTQSPIFNFVRQAEVSEKVSQSTENFIYEGPAGFGTLQSPAHVVTWMSEDDPSVIEGLRITELVLKEMQEFASSNDIQLYVMMIPTNEFVFFDHVRNELTQEQLNTYEGMVLNETRLRMDIEQSLKRNGIRTIDVYPELKAAIDNGKDIFPFNDGHPNSSGYAVIAEKIYSLLEKL